jgi:hypothetical protein
MMGLVSKDEWLAHAGLAVGPDRAADPHAGGQPSASLPPAMRPRPRRATDAILLLLRTGMQWNALDLKRPAS